MKININEKVSSQEIIEKIIITILKVDNGINFDEISSIEITFKMYKNNESIVLVYDSETINCIIQGIAKEHKNTNILGNNKKSIEYKKNINLDEIDKSIKERMNKHYLVKNKIYLFTKKEILESKELKN